MRCNDFTLLSHLGMNDFLCFRTLCLSPFSDNVRKVGGRCWQLVAIGCTTLMELKWFGMGRSCCYGCHDGKKKVRRRIQFKKRLKNLSKIYRALLPAPLLSCPVDCHEFKSCSQNKSNHFPAYCSYITRRYLRYQLESQHSNILTERNKETC